MNDQNQKNSTSRPGKSLGSNVQWLTYSNGDSIAAVVHKGREPTVIFCGGFNSDMTGQKAAFLEQTCKKEGLGFIRFDYRGHGISSGEVWQYAITDWIEDAKLVIENFAAGKILLVGSSMGGWIMSRLMQDIKERIAACVGIAVAPDFTQEMEVEINAEQRVLLEKGEVIHIPSEYDEVGYPVTARFFSEARRQLVLGRPLEVDFPVRLFHGTADNSVPWQQSIKLMENITGNDIQVTLIKGGDHRLSADSNLALLGDTVTDLAKT